MFTQMCYMLCFIQLYMFTKRKVDPPCVCVCVCRISPLLPLCATCYQHCARRKMASVVEDSFYFLLITSAAKGHFHVFPSSSCSSTALCYISRLAYAYVSCFLRFFSKAQASIIFITPTLLLS